MVTAEKIIEYVLETPYNPNKMVLRSLLESYLEDNGGSGATLEDKVIILPSKDGITTITPTEPKPGNKVTILPNPLPGKKVLGVTVITIEGEEIEVTDNKDGTYSYIQPEETVIPIIDYGSEEINPDDIIIYDGGPPQGWV